MTLDRRQFLKTSAVLGGAVGLGLPAVAEAFTADGVRPLAYRPETGDAQPKPLRILILGGTGFIGPQQVEYALARQHKLTLFNRGKTNAGLFPTVPRIIGDRNVAGGHDGLKQGTWDVVIDNPTRNPAWVRDAGVALKGRVGQYVFVSTISVFSDYSKPGMDENGPLHTPGAEAIWASNDGAAYGPNKVRCELEAKAQFGENKLTIVRPGLIVGPGDLSDRFSYWPVRIDKGGEILAPGTPNDPVQYVDVHDLSEWIVRTGENHTLGTFNATGPKGPTTIAEMLLGIKSVTTSDARFTWVPAEFLAEQKVRAWSEMPVWQPAMGPTLGFMQVNCQKAYAAGLTFRPLADTARSTLDWYKTRPAVEQEKARAGIAPEKEKAVLAAWHAKTGN
ncbi:twin-arginine translocation signal domain-containing protein [Gemmatimonas sp.]|uniref:twin-arginine translocation signal domain-containing protein n=1 Tax=Gemmatimonas sp. TaxID=1962908 RepID=UPI0022C8CB9D|nr:twin-arginine translocation signal domain-containing protein [Gemmatimonas sp.]MCZ8206097.1 twin-arginine translocation signal domain-containing protein [Gemmatimonas sp.]